MKSRFAVAVLVFLLGGGAEAVQRGQTAGVGADLCAEFDKAYAKNPKGAEDLYWSWAMGMMSGMNLASSNVFRDLTADQDLMRRANRIFCSAHPLTTYGGATLVLYVSLPLKKIGSK